MKRIRAFVLGSGNIGTDLALRMSQDSRFDLVGLVGRRPDSAGISKARSVEIPVFVEGVDKAFSECSEFDVVFDATSALDHPFHWNLVSQRNKLMIDLTPSQVGLPMVPILMGKHEEFSIVDSRKMIRNFSMITCGGQSSAALLFSFFSASKIIYEVEISSSIAARSAGLATRRNVDNYISATEDLAKLVCQCEVTKSILVLNPAEPPVMMRTTVTVRCKDLDLLQASSVLDDMEASMQQFVPGYRVVVPIHALGSNTFSATALVEGAGYYLPTYAGNLDVINAAAVETAAKYFSNHCEEVSQ